MKRCKNYINGAWTESVSGNAAPTFNPATGEELAQVVVSTPEDVDRAVAAPTPRFMRPGNGGIWTARPGEISCCGSLT